MDLLASGSEVCSYHSFYWLQKQHQMYHKAHESKSNWRVLPLDVTERDALKYRQSFLNFNAIF